MKPPSGQDELARRYLLGRLDEAEREKVGERLFADAAFFETVRAVEMELRDSYARNELSGRDREDFEQHLLHTERQRMASRMASALARRFARARVRRVLSWPQLSFAAAAAMAATAAWLGVYSMRARDELEAMRQARETVAQRVQAASGQTPAIVSLYLPGLVLRGTESLPELVLPGGETLVKLEMEVERAGAFEASLADEGGTEVWRQAVQAAADGVVNLWISSQVFEEGVMEVRLKGEGTEQSRRLRVARR